MKFMFWRKKKCSYEKQKKINNNNNNNIIRLMSIFNFFLNFSDLAFFY